ncbi:glycosyltransferase family 4 protein [candidate division KSB1 bacterium]|nr:glycosyltransferase family 4 protein [candidate division KSB1 bacterium]
MKICIDARKVFDFGIGTYLRNILYQFAKMEHGHRFFLLTAPNDLDRLQQLSNGFELVPEIAGKYSLREQFSIPRVLRRLDVDLYHSPHYVIPLIKTRPTLTIIHDVIHLIFRQQLKTPGAFYYASFMLRHAVKHSDQLVTISEWSKADIVRTLGADPAEIEVIYGAVDEFFKKQTQRDAVEMVARKLNLHSNYLLYSGAFKAHKNIDRFIRAFARLSRDECPLLVLAGDRLANYPALQATIHDLSLDDRIINPGWLEAEDFLALYQGAAAFVFPSLYEGFGLPPLEAMYCQIPVVSSNASCMPEILGEGAHYFDPNSIDDMASKIHDVLSDNSLRERLIRRGRQQAATYSWEKSARQFLTLYEKMA